MKAARVILTLVTSLVFAMPFENPAVAGGSKLSKLDCAAGEIPRFNGLEWECSADYDNDTLDDLGCAEGEIAKMIGGQWTCADDNDTDTDTLGSLSCNDGEVAKWNGTMWECAEDNKATSSFTTLEPLRMIRGRVNGSDGSKLAGQGFTSSRLGDTGKYPIVFDTAFPDFPTIVVTPSASRAVTATVYTVQLGGFTARIIDLETEDDRAESFSFIAIGPQPTSP
jgi:hypothetical protein